MRTRHRVAGISSSFPTGSTLTVTDDAGTPGNTADDPVVVKTLTDALDNGESIKVTGSVPVLPLTLMMPGETKLFSGFYYPTRANGGLTDPCEAMFSDTITAVGQSPLLAQPVTEMITANCPLCPCQ